MPHEYPLPVKDYDTSPSTGNPSVVPPGKAAQPFSSRSPPYPGPRSPTGDVQIGDRLHHRTEKRVVKVTSIGHHDDQIAFAHARQVAQITRYQKQKTRTARRRFWKKMEVAYYLCTFDQHRLPPARLAQAVREHWAAESWH